MVGARHVGLKSSEQINHSPTCLAPTTTPRIIEMIRKQVKNLQEVSIIAEKLTAAISKSFSVDGKNQNLSVSIGIALYPDDGVTQESLVNCADQAMYQIKHEQKNGYRFFSNQTRH